MLHLSHRIGNLHTNPELLNHIAQWRATGAFDEATLDERDARKSRHRLHTNAGRELGLILPRGETLQDGDIFAIREDDSKVVIHIALQEVMGLTPLPQAPEQERWQWAVRLGHVLGNQHWPVAVVGEQIFTPVMVDRAVMETVLRTHHLTEHFTIHYERRSWPTTEATHQWTTHH